MRPHLILPCLVLLVLGAARPASAQFWNDYEIAPHNYYRTDLADPMSKLITRTKAGEITIDEPTGKPLVERLLKELEIPVSSQVLVFTQTSLQRKIVNPGNPRAMYFNEDVYLGWMPGGRIEIASVDPDAGMIFFFQRPIEEASGELFVRTGRCLGCHAGSATNFIPGLLGRSVFPDKTGRGLRSIQSFERVSHIVPYDERWGGWYVTGQQHGSLNHMANAIASRGVTGISLDREAGGKIQFDLSDFYPAGTHLTEGSDVLAMLAHDHQISAHYYINQAQFKVRQALFDNQLDLDSGREVIASMKGSSRYEIKDGIRMLLRYLTFADESSLGGEPVKGGDAYRKAFLANQRKTDSGLSLKDLDLKNRLLKYRVSWMIYSKAFDGMSRAAKEETYHRLHEILTAETAPEGFEHLKPAEKRTLYQILIETKPDLAEAWKSRS